MVYGKTAKNTTTFSAFLVKITFLVWNVLQMIFLVTHFALKCFPRETFIKKKNVWRHFPFFQDGDQSRDGRGGSKINTLLRTLF